MEAVQLRNNTYLIALILAVSFILGVMIIDAKASLIVAILGLLALIVFFFKWHILVMLFIIVFPISNKISYFEIGFMDLNKFVMITLLLSFIVIYNFKFIVLDKNKKIILTLFIFWHLVYNQYCQIKGMIVGYEIYDEQYVINLIVWIFNAIACYLILSRSNDELVKKSIELGLILGTIILVVSAFSYDMLLQLGINTKVIYEGKESTYVRSSGIYTGHPTQFSALMSIMFGYFLSRYLISDNFKSRSINFLMMVVVFSSFIINSSRNGLIGCIAILVVFALKERRKGGILLTSLLAIAIMVILYFYGETIMYRMNKEQFSYILQYSRLHLLWVHFSEIIQNPAYLIFGTVKPYYLNTHNTYLELVYYGGIAFLVIFIVLNYKIFKNRFHAHFDILYPMIGYLVPLAGNNNKVELYYILILALAFSTNLRNGKTAPKN